MNLLFQKFNHDSRKLISLDYIFYHKIIRCDFKSLRFFKDHKFNNIDYWLFIFKTLPLKLELNKPTIYAYFCVADAHFVFEMSIGVNEMNVGKKEMSIGSKEIDICAKEISILVNEINIGDKEMNICKK